ncbi:uncharacterized protein LOC135847947 [Planococcus citri]|uniref:uncharacterized protein LOC135847947 n=1 Tax=Planococcus citri TaxID=170843 RepID=UPI0031F9ECEA
MLKQTGKSVEVISPSTTNGTVTGGVFGDDLYKFYKFLFNFQICGNNVTFEIRDFFYNTLYNSFENSLNYENGIIQVFINVDVSGKKNNPLFNKFMPALKKVKEPGDSIQVDSEKSFAWFKNFPTGAVYTFFRSSLFNVDDGKTYSCATTVDLPKEKKLNYMSREQFDETFGEMVDENGKKLNNLIPPKDEPTSSVKQAKGIKVTSI